MTGIDAEPDAGSKVKAWKVAKSFRSSLASLHSPSEIEDEPVLVSPKTICESVGRALNNGNSSNSAAASSPQNAEDDGEDEGQVVTQVDYVPRPRGTYPKTYRSIYMRPRYLCQHFR